MNEQKCKKLIQSDLEQVRATCDMLLQDIDGADLTDVDNQIDRITRHLTDAKLRLRDCEDY